MLSRDRVAQHSVDATPENANGSCEVVVRADPKPNEDAAENQEQAPEDNDEQ